MALPGAPKTSLQSTVAGGPEASVRARFASAVKRFGDQVALVAGSRSVTYRDLDLISDSFARVLAARGVNPGDRVALLLPRSVEAIAIILAILKRGAAYVPLDPSYPAPSNAQMLADARPLLVVGAEALLAQLPETGPELATGALTKVDMRDVTAQAAAARPGLEPLPPPPDDPDAVAYIMYTSGSTGRPKGVMVPHRGIIRLVCNPSYMTLGPDDVILHTGPLAFDASTWEIWGALLNGARLVIVPDIVPSVQTLGELVGRHGVTALLLTTGLFHLVAEHDLSPFASVRQFVTGGDVLSPQHAARVSLQLPNCAVINAYGPTENTVITCAYTLPKGATGAGSVPIGTAVAGTAVHILDDNLKPVADGESGQLAAGGSGVALGYFGRDDLTAQAFVDNRIDAAGGKIYLTGDLARRRPDGLIEFLGRMDRQIKIAGKRVELEDIEIRLRSDQRVQDACVVTRTHDGQTLIGVYLKPASWPVAETFADTVLGDFRATVPAAMVPVEAMTLERFPLNANGKIDRKALPAFVTAAVHSPPSAASGTTADTSGVIAAIWARVLGRTVPSHSLNFFDLGGTSLAMVRVHADLTSHFGVALSMTQLFAHPTVERLASLIDGRSQPTGERLAAARARGQRQRAIVTRLVPTEAM